MIFEDEMIATEMNSVYVNDGENGILFLTDNKKEIEAVKQYFECIWSCSDNKNAKKYVCKVISRRVENYERMRDEIAFVPKKEIFYDLQNGYVFENKYYYIIMREHKQAITVYDKINRNIFYLRSSNEVHNIHLSQLIKEPLNSIRKANGFIQLHCSACSLNGSTFVFPAQKGAGKSTLLMGMLGCGCNYLGNDSLFVKAIDGTIKVRTNPHAIRLGNETIEYNLYLKNKLKSMQNANKYKMLYNDLIMNGKVQIVPKALTEIFPKTIIDVSEELVNYFIFPQLDVNEDRYFMISLSTEDAKENLVECIRSADHRICWIPFFEENKLKEVEQKSLLNMFDALPQNLYTLIYGGDGIRAAKMILSNLGK